MRETTPEERELILQVNQLKEQVRMHVEASTFLATQVEKVVDAIMLGIATDGAHQKQWCLVQAMEKLYPAKLTPLREAGALDEGIAP